jgi:hypothetical protein
LILSKISKRFERSKVLKILSSRLWIIFKKYREAIPVNKVIITDKQELKIENKEEDNSEEEDSIDLDEI